MKAKYTLPLLAAALALPLTAGAQDAAPKKPQAKKPVGALAPTPTHGLALKDGDRFIFIGDSITHQCLYTQYTENFFYTRYPNLRLHFRNAGVSGDHAQDALNRFDEDIAEFKPTIATILLGMNDGGYKDFDQATFDTYAKGMTELLDKLDAIKCRVVLMSPTMYDTQAKEAQIAKTPDNPKLSVAKNYNGVLAYYGKWAQEVARKRGYQFVDLFGPLNTYTVEERKLDKNFTLIPDAVHPQKDGQFVMSYSLLQQTGETGGIFGAGVRLMNGEWKSLAPAMVTGISGDPGKSVSYSVKMKALPWAEFEDAPIGTKLTKSGHTGSQESHIVVGLQAGRYDLKINDQVVGTFDEKMLGVHAEIEQMATSPTYQQAMKVIALNKERNDKAVHPLRDLWGKQKGMFNKKDADKDAYEKWQVEFKAKRAELDALADQYEAQIYQINKPGDLKVDVVPSTTPEPAKPATTKPVASKAPEKKAA
jgi:lysophospholipase L1-like esterase